MLIYFLDFKTRHSVPWPQLSRMLSCFWAPVSADHVIGQLRVWDGRAEAGTGVWNVFILNTYPGHPAENWTKVFICPIWQDTFQTKLSLRNETYDYPVIYLSKVLHGTGYTTFAPVLLRHGHKISGSLSIWIITYLELQSNSLPSCLCQPYIGMCREYWMSWSSFICLS